VAGKDALPVEDLAAIAEYARRYHLAVIPAVFTYGKVQDLFNSHPEIAEAPDWQKKRGESAYCPNRPETYALIFDIMKEIVEATKCPAMHIGHDEIMGMALCPVCRNVPPADLFANDVNRIAGWLAERNVETMIWGDFLLDRERWEPLGVSSANSGSPHYGGHVVHPAVEKIRKDVIIADWHYNVAKTYPSVKYFADCGFRVIGCPWHKSENNYFLAQEVKRDGQMGMLVTDWGFLATRSPGADSMIGVACAWNTAMPEPKRLPWSPEAVLAGSILDKDKPSRMRGAVFAPVPIEPVGTRGLARGGEAWFGVSERHDLSYLPTGAQRLFGVDYQIGQRCIVADGKAPAPRIPVNAKAKSLVFLHGLSVENPGVGLAPFGQYRVTYASGEKAEVVIDGRKATYWLTETPRQNPWMPWLYGYTWDATLAWEGCTRSGEAVNLQAYEWVNPRPDDPIASVEIVARPNVPGLQIGLVALTAVQ
jgi:hypothetical protein